MNLKSTEKIRAISLSQGDPVLTKTKCSFSLKQTKNAISAKASSGKRYRSLGGEGGGEGGLVARVGVGVCLGSLGWGPCIHVVAVLFWLGPWGQLYNVYL